MKRIRYSSIAAGLVLALGGVAVAQNQGQGQSQRHQSFQSSEHGQRASQEMMQLDRDRDQRLTQQEAQSDPQLVAAWADIDVTRDGSVDATEYYLYAAQRRIAELESGPQGQAQSRSGQSASGSQSGSAQSSSSARQSDAGSDTDRSDARASTSARGEPAGQSQSANERGSSSDDPSFDELDRNNDGQIDRQEFQLSQR